MPDYRYLFADMLTGRLLEELPVACQSYSQTINGVGTMTGTVPLTDLSPVLDWRSATLPRHTLVLVVRDGTIAWGGYVLKRRPVRDSTAAEIGCETIEGYLGRRRIKTDLTETSADVFQIVRDIITQLQSRTGGNIRLAVTSGAAGQTATVTYQGKDRTKALDAINRLAQVSPGFEYTVTWARSGQIFTPTLNLVAGSLSSTADPVLLEFPGSLVSPVDDPEDGADAPNAVTGVGADAAGSPLIAESVDTTGELAGGYALFEDEVSMREESDFTRLQARTDTALAARLSDHVVPQVELRPPQQDTDLQFGDFPLGVPVRLRCTCPYHPAGTGGAPGLDVSTRRVTGWTVTPTPVEKTVLNLGAITGLITPPKANRDTAAYLRDLDRRLLWVETNT